MAVRTEPTNYSVPVSINTDSCSGVPVVAVTGDARTRLQESVSVLRGRLGDPRKRQPRVTARSQGDEVVGSDGHAQCRALAG